MAPRTVRMLALLELEVKPHSWTGEHIEEAVRVMIEALSWAAEDTPAGNIRVARYRVHTLGNAYARLLETP